MKRFIGVLLFDAGTTFKEFQKIICNFLKEGFTLEIVAEPKRHQIAATVPLTISPPYSAWQLVICKEN